jgi:tryptophanyl-tRNA synthetase
MNAKFGEMFTVPQDWKHQLDFASLDNGVRIRSLTHPDKKMSKSISDPKGTILLSDDPSAAAKKVLSATTDSVGTISFDWQAQPGITNLLQILALLSGREQSEVNAEWAGQSSYGDLKKAVAKSVETFLSEFQHRFADIDDAKLIAKLENSEKAMNEIAQTTLLRVQQAVGLRPRQ